MLLLIEILLAHCALKTRKEQRTDTLRSSSLRNKRNKIAISDMGHCKEKNLKFSSSFFSFLLLFIVDTQQFQKETFVPEHVRGCLLDIPLIYYGKIWLHGQKCVSR